MTAPTPPPLVTTRREALAEALSWTSGEMTRWSESAHPDHNRWSWRGDGHGEARREEFRAQADALLALGFGFAEDEALDLVRARHQESLNTDIHGEPLCMTCGFRDSWPCAPARLAAALTARAEVSKVCTEDPDCIAGPDHEGPHRHPSWEGDDQRTTTARAGGGRSERLCGHGSAMGVGRGDRWLGAPRSPIRGGVQSPRGVRRPCRIKRTGCRPPLRHLRHAVALERRKPPPLPKQRGRPWGVQR